MIITVCDKMTAAVVCSYLVVVTAGAAAMRSALIVVDVQDCFTSGGSLAVADGDAVVPVINELRARHHFDVVVVSQDWHCPRHISFASSHPGHNVYDTVSLHYMDNGTLCLGPSFGAQQFPLARQCPDSSLTLQQGLWPDHCVEGVTSGPTSSSLNKGLNTEPDDIIIKKGNDCYIDSYSVFYDNGRLRSTGLGDRLRAAGVTDVFVTGLALDYCVYYTALDARRLGFETYTVLDAARGVQDDTVAEAKRDMVAKGIHLIHSADVGDALAVSGGAGLAPHVTEIVVLFTSFAVLFV